MAKISRRRGEILMKLTHAGINVGAVQAVSGGKAAVSR
jgi:hypothetical protein